MRVRKPTAPFTLAKPTAGRRFTPRDHDGKRYEMVLAAESEAAWAELTGRSRRWVEITDAVTGLRYMARRASCGLRCYCDALVRPGGEED